MSTAYAELVESVHANSTAYRTEVERLLADGWQYAATYATSDGAMMRTLLAEPTGTTRLVSVTTDGGHALSIVDLAPAAGWDEREAADLYGLDFVGHAPLRPLVDHVEDGWTVPVGGDGPYQVAVGPIHAGVIESGHFRFHVVGDRILHLDARLFYKHRGLERAAEGQTLADGMRYVSRACAACAVSNGVAFAHACEQALGLTPTTELARTRTILAELERTWNHLNDIAAVCAGAGLAAGNHYFAALTEQARRLNVDLTGHRFLFGAVRVGESHLEADHTKVLSLRDRLRGLRHQAATGWRELVFNTSFQDRLHAIGVLNAEQAARLGTVGPAARAAGIARDLRAHSPRLTYPAFQPAVPEPASGDAKARLAQRAVELWQSLTMLDNLLDRPLTPTTAEPGATQAAIGVGRVESARGATACVIERDGERLRRLHLRTGSYANWPSVAHAAAGNLLPDFPLINKSFELCYACADR
jgi:Ni,Fe-hydrogenase III large subunit